MVQQLPLAGGVQGLRRDRSHRAWSLATVLQVRDVHIAAALVAAVPGHSPAVFQTQVVDHDFGHPGIRGVEGIKGIDQPLHSLLGGKRARPIPHPVSVVLWERHAVAQVTSMG